MKFALIGPAALGAGCYSQVGERRAWLNAPALPENRVLTGPSCWRYVGGSKRLLRAEFDVKSEQHNHWPQGSTFAPGAFLASSGPGEIHAAGG